MDNVKTISRDHELREEDLTHVKIEDIQLPGAGVFALVTLVGAPAVLSADSLHALSNVLLRVQERANTGEYCGVGIVGEGRYFVAGADLKMLRQVTEESSARAIAELGHQVFDLVEGMSVPTFAFINGTAIGGGLELALAADFRTIATDVSAVSLPEAFLGLIPGWGGVYRLPRIVGPNNAVTVMVKNALSNNKALSGVDAFDMGIADELLEQENFLEESMRWATRLILGDESSAQQIQKRRDLKAHAERSDWADALEWGRKFVAAKTGQAAPAPLRLLDLVELGENLSRAESAKIEVQTLTELILSPQFKDSTYAFLDLISRRSKRPSGLPGSAVAKTVTKVGVIGAGLMASQLALLFIRQLQVPVVLTDIDQVRVDRGVQHVIDELDALLAKKKLSQDDADRQKDLISGSVSKENFADADFVIEAVFEELSVKKQVFGEIEEVVSDTCILATNTSSLSVSQMAADLRHPERVVGFHFFNPVAAMPLVEIVATPKTTGEALATAAALAKSLKKTTVLVQDSTGFVVNRILLRLMADIVKAFDDGTPAHVADNALDPMGLPMTPFELLAMIGLPVAHHVTKSLNASFGERFPVSKNLEVLISHQVKALWAKDQEGQRYIPPSTLDLLTVGSAEVTAEQLLKRVEDGLAEEIGLLLTEGVVDSAQDVDLCMLTGARWPLHLGGITPYLDRRGASQRVNGKLFHPASR